LKKKILLIGASTGGPSLIKELLSGIESLSYTIVIAQHMKEEILPSFIHDLQNSLKVKVYSTPLKANFNEPSIIVCSHTSAIQKNALGYEIVTTSERQHYTPDINILFNSFANISSDFDIKALIMTGIGSDGVKGAKLLKSKGAKIFAQDEKSSPVYGMPRVAVESGIVDKIKSFDEIKEFFRYL